MRKTADELKTKKPKPVEEEKTGGGVPAMDDLDAMMAGLENMGGPSNSGPA
jgi:hypothetical protein